MTVVAFLVSACGFGSDASDGEADVASGGRTRAGADHPPGTDPDAVAPYVSELLLAYDRLVNEINADPAIAHDPDDPLIVELLGLFELDEGLEQGWIDGWVAQAEDGVHTEPFSEDYPALTTMLDGQVETVSDDEVRVPICVVNRSQVVEGDGGDERGGDDVAGNDDPGSDVLGLPRVDQPGEASAVLIDGQWRLREIYTSQHEFGCRGDQP